MATLAQLDHRLWSAYKFWLQVGVLVNVIGVLMGSSRRMCSECVEFERSERIRKKMVATLASGYRPLDSCQVQRRVG